MIPYVLVVGCLNFRQVGEVLGEVDGADLDLGYASGVGVGGGVSAVGVAGFGVGRTADAGGAVPVEGCW